MKPIENIFGFDCVTCEHNRHCYGGNMGNQFRYCQKSTEKIQNLGNLEQENKQLKGLIDTILNFSFFKEECPLNFGFEDNSKEDKAQNIFYSDEYCENNCNDIYTDCWLKYFKELQGSDSNE